MQISDKSIQQKDPDPPPLMYTNYDLNNMVTPVDADRFQELLVQADYDKKETEFIIDGFRNRFDLGFRGTVKGVRRFAPNLKLRVGNEVILWNKVMKEVKLGRYAGPYDEPPFDEFIQSPIGLVPKDNGNDTRLIFHLSYPRTGGESINSETPTELCSVKYPDFGDAVHLCMDIGKNCKMAKSDFRSAFHMLGMKVLCFKFPVMKARSPIDGKWYYFVDKCLPFGASISCSHFQRVSNAIAFLISCRIQHPVINYLDDYFFAALTVLLCDVQVEEFLKLCEEIKFPVSLEKTSWSSAILVFLGFLINSEMQTILVPRDKIEKAQTLWKKFYPNGR